MEFATNFRNELLKHDNFKRLRHNDGLTTASRGFTIDFVDSPKAPVRSRYMAGITAALREKFWPKYKFKAALKNVPGFKRAAEKKTNTTVDEVPKEETLRKRSYAKIRADAIRRGNIVHSQVAAYIRALARNPQTAEAQFAAWLGVSHQRAHPGAVRLISSFNEVNGTPGAPLVARFIPIWSEVPVCDTWTLQNNKKAVAWATLIDAIVYDTVTECITLVEFKTSTAAFEESSQNMESPLDFQEDSPVKQAFTQLMVGMQLFRRTYEDLVVIHQIKGMVVVVSPDGLRSKRYFMDEEHEGARILNALASIHWFSTGKTK